MLSLIFQEARSIFELYYLPMLFLSGQLVPIYLMPGWVVTAAKVLPFYYTTALPVDIVIGRLAPVQAHSALLIQVLWIGVHLVVARYLWHFGIKHYTAVGM
jgi:ABC-2 type transport system permease protein